MIAQTAVSRRICSSLFLSCVFAVLFTLSALAANPTQGTLGPGSTTPLQWDGTALGAPSGTGEAACQDGINCDVFTVHLSGNASDYAGKQLLIKITFLAASDYDMYVHKDTLTGKTIFPAGNGSQPGTS